MRGVERTCLIGAVSMSLVAACAAGEARRELGAVHDPGVGRLCEVTVGMAREALPQGRVILRYPEGMEEERLIVPLCGGTTTVELSFDFAGRVDRIILSEGGLCLHGLCIGDRYGEASRKPHVRAFSTRAEGGMVALERSDIGIGYSFDLGKLPGECLDGPRPCSRADALRLDAIIVSRPDGAQLRCAVRPFMVIFFAGNSPFADHRTRPSLMSAFDPLGTSASCADCAVEVCRGA